MMANMNGSGEHRSGPMLLVTGLVTLALAIGSGIGWLIKASKDKKKEEKKKDVKKNKEKKPEAAPAE
jgi:hypothetical protein